MADKSNSNRKNSQKKSQKKSLGRGLSALISTPVSTKPEDNNKRGLSGGSASFNDNSNIPDNNISVQDASGRASLVGGKSSTYRQGISKASKPSKAEAPIAKDDSDRIVFLSPDQLSSNKSQPRTIFKEQELQELASSIKEHGLIQPIVVRVVDRDLNKEGGTSYQIVAGERRWRASKIAKLSQVPVIIRDLPDRETMEIALIENIQRENLNPAEEARAYQALMDDYNLSQQELADKVGKSRSAVANFVRVLKLAPQVLLMLEGDQISMGHAKALLTVKEPQAQLNLAKKAIAENLSVRELEGITDRNVGVKSRASKSATSKKGSSTDYAYLEDKLKNIFGTKVAIRSKKNGVGTINLSFFSEEELARLVESLEGKAWES